MKIQVKGFQATYEPVTIEVEGLTVVTGESNIGKSALVRAVMGLFTNKGGNNFITTGMEKAETTVNNQGHQVTWSKGKTTTTYTVDGEVLAKAGRGDPPKGVYDLGIKPLSVKGKVVWPQVKRQVEEYFILTESPEIAAELLAADKHGPIIALALKKAKQALQKETAVQDAYDGQQLEQASVIRRIEVVEVDLDRAMQRLEALEIEKTTEEIRLAKLQELQQRYQTERQRRDAAASRPVDPPQPVPPLETLALKTLQQRYHTNYPKTQLKLPILNTPLVDLGSLLKQKSLQRDYRTQRQKLSVPLPRIQDTPAWDLPRIERLKKLQKARPRHPGILPKVLPLPEFTDPTKLRTCRDVRRSVLKKREQAHDNTQNAKIEEAAIAGELQKILTDLGYCPVCRRTRD